jgi:hypothetical protein
MVWQLRPLLVIVFHKMLLIVFTDITTGFPEFSGTQQTYATHCIYYTLYPCAWAINLIIAFIY